MPDVISNTSPMLYLHRIGILTWLPELFKEVWIPGAGVSELQEGQRRGYDVPNPDTCAWLRVVDPSYVPSE